MACRHRWPRNRGHIQRDERGAHRRIGHATSPSRGGERDADRLGQTAAQLMNGAGRGGSGTVPNWRGTGWPAGPAGPAQHRPRPAQRPGHREARPPRVRWCPERPARRPRRRRRRGHRSSLPGRPCRISGPARGWPDAGCPRRGGPGRASGILPFPGMAHVDHDRAVVPAPRSSRSARPDRGPAGDGGTARGGDRDRDARLMCARRRGCPFRPRGHSRRGGAHAGPGEIPSGHGGRRDQRGRRPVRPAADLAQAKGPAQHWVARYGMARHGPSSPGRGSSCAGSGPFPPSLGGGEVAAPGLKGT